MMVFIKTKRGLINAEYIVRVNRTDDPDAVLVEYRTANVPNDDSDHRFSSTFAPMAEMSKIGLVPDDFDYLPGTVPVY